MPILIVCSGKVLKLKEQVPPVMSQVQVVMFNEYGIAQAGRELHPHEQSEFWVIGIITNEDVNEDRVRGTIFISEATLSTVGTYTMTLTADVDNQYFSTSFQIRIEGSCLA